MNSLSGTFLDIEGSVDSFRPSIEQVFIQVVLKSLESCKWQLCYPHLPEITSTHSHDLWICYIAWYSVYSEHCSMGLSPFVTHVTPLE